MGTASERGSDLFLYGRDFISTIVKSDREGISFDYSGKGRFDHLSVPLCGTHQGENAALAVKATELVMEQTSISEQSLREGLAGTRWPGRMELIRKEGSPYDFLIDGAHNPAASRVLADSLQRFYVSSYGKIILILGIMSDKDISGIMEPLLPLASEVIFTAPGYARAASPRELSERALSLGFMSATANSLQEALDRAIRIIESYPPSDVRHLIVVTGSFYTIGEAKTALGHEGILTRLRE
jgi:dihydrofolate synthase/folylpolyglutamate synthase